MGAQAAADLAGRGGALVGVAPAGVDLPRTGRLTLALPAGFALDRTARSHGWCALAPCAYDPVAVALHRTLALPDAGPLTVTVRRGGRVSWGRVRGSAADRAEIRRQVTRMLGLDVPLIELYDACDTTGVVSWARAAGAGRMLASPTVFEDLARTLASTNCSWALTTATVARLVAALGAEGPAGERAFPTPAAVAAAGVGVLREVVRAGYRAESFVALAGQGERVERWLEPQWTDEELLAEIQSLRGFGPYAAQGMLGLLGRPRGLALDSWVRAQLPEVLGSGPLSDAEIAARYAPLGRWAGTALWLELTASWFPDSGAPRHG